MGNRFDKLKAIISGFKHVKSEETKSVERERLDAGTLSAEAKNLISELFKEFGARPAASKESRRTARVIASYFDKYLNNSLITSTRIYTSVFQAALISLLLVSFLSFLLILFNMPLLSFLLVTVWFISLYLEIKGKKKIFSIFMPSDEATNVHSVLEPEDIAEETIVFSAHHDTARVKSKNKNALLLDAIAHRIPFLAVFSIWVTSFVLFFYDISNRLFKPGIPSSGFVLVAFISLLFSSFALLCLKTSNTSYSSGAGDDLAGIVILIELSRYFKHEKEMGSPLRHTRLVFASFDGEEYGAQGSNAWYRANNQILSNVRVLNFNRIYGSGDLVFISQNENISESSYSLSAKCASIASSLGYNINNERNGIALRETDATSAIKAGHRATTLTSLGIPSSDDIPDSVDQKALEIALATAIKFAETEDDAWVRKDDAEKPNFIDQDKKYILTR